MAAQRFDDDLFRIVQTIDEQSESHVSGFGTHDVLRHRLWPHTVGWGVPQDGLQAYQREQGSAEPQDFRVFHALDPRCRFLAFHSHQFAYARLRNRITVAGAVYDQAGNDRQRQRQIDADRRSRAEFGFHRYAAADPLDVRLDHVHTNVPAADVDPFLGQRKAGTENQAQGLAVVHRAGPKFVSIGKGGYATCQVNHFRAGRSHPAESMSKLRKLVPAYVGGLAPGPCRIRRCSGRLGMLVRSKLMKLSRACDPKITGSAASMTVPGEARTSKR